MKHLLTFGLLVNLLFPVHWAIADEAHVDHEWHHVTIRLSDYRFTPSRIELKVGEATELTIVNEGTIMHEFVTLAFFDITVDVEVNGVIAETMGIVELELPAQATATLRFTPETPGEFDLACRAREPKNHFEEGMAGKIIIKADE